MSGGGRGAPLLVRVDIRIHIVEVEGQHPSFVEQVFEVHIKLFYMRVDALLLVFGQVGNVFVQLGGETVQALGLGRLVHLDRLIVEKTDVGEVGGRIGTHVLLGLGEV